MFRFFVGCVFLQTFFISDLRAQANQLGAVSLNYLLNEIQTKNLMSVEDVLSRPAMAGSIFTFIHTSRSAQRSDVSPALPRAVVTLPGGLVTIAFTGLPGGTHFHFLEMIGFDDQTKKFETARIQFSPNSTAPSIERNPSSCTGCHTKKVRPIWDSYNKWSGVYGTPHELLEIGSEQLKTYREFFENRNARYLQLPWPHQESGEELPPYAVGVGAKDVTLNLAKRPNTVMGMIWIRQNIQRVLSALQKSDRYSKAWHYLLFTDLSCSFYTNNRHRHRIESNNRLIDKRYKLEFPQEKSVLPFNKLVRLLGAAPEDFNLSLGSSPGLTDFEDGITDISKLMIGMHIDAVKPRLPKSIARLIEKAFKLTTVENSLFTIYGGQPPPDVTAPESLVWAKTIDTYGRFLNEPPKDSELNTVCEFLLNQPFDL